MTARPATPNADTRPSKYRAVCAGLTFHISCCMAGCSDARGSLCPVGERLNMRLLDMLASFDDAEMDAALAAATPPAPEGPADE